MSDLTPTTPAEIVATAASALFGDRNVSAVGTYFGPIYTQHSTLANDETKASWPSSRR